MGSPEKVTDTHKLEDIIPVESRENAYNPFQETVRALMQIKKNPEAYLDQGGAGLVYHLPSGVCMKVPKSHYENPREGMDLGNPLPVEADFLRRLSGAEHHGVRTPSFLGLVQSKEMLALLMEELPAANMQKVIDGKEPLPENFSYHTFFDALEDYIHYLHDNYQILHGDFEARNVMIDTRTGMPYVIDFGRSRLLNNIPEETRQHLTQKELASLDKMSDAFFNAENKGVLTYNT